jgi:hypothetical protein
MANTSPPKPTANMIFFENLMGAVRTAGALIIGNGVLWQVMDKPAGNPTNLFVGGALLLIIGSVTPTLLLALQSAQQSKKENHHE